MERGHCQQGRPLVGGKEDKGQGRAKVKVQQLPVGKDGCDAKVVRVGKWHLAATRPALACMHACQVHPCLYLSYYDFLFPVARLAITMCLP